MLSSIIKKKYGCLFQPLNRSDIDMVRKKSYFNSMLLRNPNLSLHISLDNCLYGEMVVSRFIKASVTHDSSNMVIDFYYSKVDRFSRIYLKWAWIQDTLIDDDDVFVLLKCKCIPINRNSSS